MSNCSSIICWEGSPSSIELLVHHCQNSFEHICDVLLFTEKREGGMLERSLCPECAVGQGTCCAECFGNKEVVHLGGKHHQGTPLQILCCASWQNLPGECPVPGPAQPPSWRALWGGTGWGRGRPSHRQLRLMLLPALPWPHKAEVWTGLCLATPPTGHSVPISCSQIMGRYNVNFRGGSRWSPDLTLSGTHLHFPHPPLLSLGSGSPSFPQLSHDVTLRPLFPRPWAPHPAPKDSPTPDVQQYWN